MAGSSSAVETNNGTLNVTLTLREEHQEAVFVCEVRAGSTTQSASLNITVLGNFSIISVNIVAIPYLLRF